MLVLSRKSFAECFTDPELHRKVVASITETIAETFAVGHPGAMAAPTMAELKRRFALCEKWYRDLRGQKQWSIERALAALKDVLRTELGGGTYEPDDRQVWAPGQA